MRLHPDVSDALERGRPAVALESTIIAHGLPRPDNLRVAREVEAAVRDGGAVPATIAVLGGEPRVGLDAGELERLAGGTAVKCGVRDLAPLMARGGDGATTVAATAHLAARAGIRVSATGGGRGGDPRAPGALRQGGRPPTPAHPPVSVLSA